jgi:hypothetical protein
MAKRRGRKAAGMAKRGSRCTARKLVYSRTLGKKVKRCTKFSK